jgi:hypothetical protein
MSQAEISRRHHTLDFQTFLIFIEFLLCIAPSHPSSVSNYCTPGSHGSLVIVAVRIEYDGMLHTTDRHFARFPDLRWVNPPA